MTSTRRCSSSVKTPIGRCPTILAAVLAFASCACAHANALEADSTRVPPVHVAAVDSASAAPSPALPDSSLSPAPQHDPQETLHPPLDRVALGLGFENVTLDASTQPPSLAYENRRYRHSADALGWIMRGGDSFIAYERRLGMVAASIERTGAIGAGAPFRVRYPSDGDFHAPRGHVQEPTSHSIDLTVGPLVAYDLGRVTEPVQFQFQTEATLRWNPWTGSRFIGSVVFPIYNDFVFNPLHPDLDNVRPGLVTLEQYAWVPRVGLASASGGVFADNRYGVSLGIARPLMQGAVLLDAQTDLTGFVAFNTGGLGYSPLRNWSSYGAVTWRPAWMDAQLRARYAQYLYGDHGADLEFKRSFGDLDLAFSVLRSNNLTIEGVRISFPIPPLTRPTQRPIRLLPVEHFPLSYRTDATPVGQSVVGTASREDFLRQLSAPALAANSYRYERAQGRKRQLPPPQPAPWINHSGMTGFIITPWAGVQPSGEVEVGFTNIPKKWSYAPRRGVFHNEIYYVSMGLLPRLEVGLRITRTPGFNPFADVDPESRLTTDTDHMASFRISVLEPRDRRPGLALGVDDIEGTRRYHSAYLVSGVPFSIFRVQNRFSLGYASHVFTAYRHVLDGGFGAIEVSPWRAVAARIEYDTEKVNVGLGLDLGYGLRIRAAALNMESLSVGVGWHHKL